MRLASRCKEEGKITAYEKTILIIAATKRQNCEMLVQAMLSDAIQARPILMDPLSQCSIIKMAAG